MGEPRDCGCRDGAGEIRLRIVWIRADGSFRYVPGAAGVLAVAALDELHVRSREVSGVAHVIRRELTRLLEG